MPKPALIFFFLFLFVFIFVCFFFPLFFFTDQGEAAEGAGCQAPRIAQLLARHSEPVNKHVVAHEQNALVGDAVASQRACERQERRGGRHLHADAVGAVALPEGKNTLVPEHVSHDG